MFQICLPSNPQIVFGSQIHGLESHLFLKCWGLGTFNAELRAVLDPFLPHNTTSATVLTFGGPASLWASVPIQVEASSLASPWQGCILHTVSCFESPGACNLLVLGNTFGCWRKGTFRGVLQLG